MRANKGRQEVLDMSDISTAPQTETQLLTESIRALPSESFDKFEILVVNFDLEINVGCGNRELGGTRF